LHKGQLNNNGSEFKNWWINPKLSMIVKIKKIIKAINNNPSIMYI